ncbi:hypothetical protein KHA94_15280 [Bacillus sp. FJAT-49705]|uniref:LysR substrate-binding domain-containing protein n=1 Tax=Cytobacillus citreus TaxID=2833586 RepID=A0ABS5NUP5_9BACI|nr:hypothetical protein [Cytobacillus citreus]MBS4191551.1 hypothetical protein [Cytobacillus citreus]
MNESLRSVMAGYGAMLAPSLGVEEYVKRREVGRVKVKGVEISRPVFLCSRKSDDSISNNVKKFTEFVKSIYLLEGSRF